MADQTVKFTSVASSSSPSIQVDFEYVELKKNDTITFSNTLGGGKPIEVQFFKTAADKAQSSNPIAGFCDGVSGTVLTVPNGGTADCKMVNGGWLSHQSFAYKASTPGNSYDPGYHVPLDPVIIIQPTMFMITLPMTAAVAGVASAIVGLLAYRAGLAKARKEAERAAG